MFTGDKKRHQDTHCRARLCGFNSHFTVKKFDQHWGEDNYRENSFLRHRKVTSDFFMNNHLVFHSADL